MCRHSLAVEGQVSVWRHGVPLQHMSDGVSAHLYMLCACVCDAVLQGSAADIVKSVMVGLREQLSSTGLAQHCHMLLQVGVDAHIMQGRSCMNGRVSMCLLLLLVKASGNKNNSTLEH